MQVKLDMTQFSAFLGSREEENKGENSESCKKKRRQFPLYSIMTTNIIIIGETSYHWLTSLVDNVSDLGTMSIK